MKCGLHNKRALFDCALPSREKYASLSAASGGHARSVNPLLCQPERTETLQTPERVTPKTCIQEAFGTNVGRRTGDLEFFRGFLSPPEENAGIGPPLGHGPFLPNSFQFISHATSRHYGLHLRPVGPQVLTVVNYLASRSCREPYSLVDNILDESTAPVFTLQ